MEIIITLIGTVIGAVIGWNIQPFKGKGKGRFTRLEINDDGTLLLEFDFKRRFGKVGDNATDEIATELNEDFKGLTEVTVIRNRSNELTITFKLEKEKDEPFILMLEEQEKALTYLCRNY